jgi:hypothetical protein
MFVGTYIFRASDPGFPHSPDQLTVDANGRYVLVHILAGRPGTKEEGRWQLFRDDLGWQFAFGNRVYPIEVKGQHVRLVYSDDDSWWYEKSSVP